MLSSPCWAAQSWAAQIPWPLPQGPAPSGSEIELGKQLFFNTALSANGTYSCATCHNPELHFTDGRQLAVGVFGDLHDRNTPTLYNVVYNTSFGWEDDGVSNLRDQHRIPLTGQAPIEMGFDAAALARLNKNQSLRTEFKAVYGSGDIQLDRIVAAIAAYVGTLRHPANAFDRFVYLDDRTALSSAAQEGMALFFSDRLGCSGCHSGFTMSGPIRYTGHAGANEFHNTAVNGSTLKFRAPTLRAIAHTAPYMHDGSIANLEAVLDHYQTTAASSVPEFALSPAERQALLAFLRTL